MSQKATNHERSQADAPLPAIVRCAVCRQVIMESPPLRVAVLCGRCFERFYDPATDAMRCCACGVRDAVSILPDRGMVCEECCPP